MNSPCFLRTAGALTLLPLIASIAFAADNTTKAPTPANRPTSSAKGGTAGRILPDPALLDGAAHAPDKKSENGMIGDFELPGDENAKSGKVGGSPNQNPPPPGGGGGQQSNMPMGLPSGGGASGQQQGQQGQPPAGAQSGGAQSSQSGGQQAGGQQGGPQNANAGGAPIAGGGDPGAQPQGNQVSELGGDPSGQQGGAAGGPGEKPQQVAIGDKAMRIDNSGAAQAGVVGAQQQAGATQQHEKGTGSGGKGAGGAGGPNRVEKGRAIPSGL